MKTLKKALALMLALTVVFAYTAVGAFAADGDTGTITIKNAAKGETYKVIKLFDAHLGDNGAISYTGDIPEALNDYFTKDSTGNIHKATGKSDSEIAEAVQNWGKTATGGTEKVASGSALVFDGLDFGYYAITSSQGTVVSVDSTNPDAVVYDKNTTEPSASKTVKKESYSIGDTVNYTATFDTTNYMGEGEDSQQVIKYEISDTLPEFLSNVAVDSIKIMDGETEVAVVTAQFNNKKIVLDWADAVENSDPLAWTSKYKNGVQIVVNYHGTLTSVTNINAADTNTVSIKPIVDNGTPTGEPWEDSWESSKEIKTYAAALKKTDENGNKLAGAQFTIKGLTVTGSAGEYTVVSYDPESNEQSATLDTNADGKLYIIGLASDVELVVTEVKAPSGYNKLDDPISLKPQVLSTAIYKESGSVKYDKDGNVIASDATATTTETVEKNLTELDAQAVQVKNSKGTPLPSTGGIGTTLFYVFGAILVVGAGILLIARRRMQASK